MACVIGGQLTEPPGLDTLAARKVGDPDYINNFFFLPAERLGAGEARRFSNASAAAASLK